MEYIEKMIIGYLSMAVFTPKMQRRVTEFFSLCVHASIVVQEELGHLSEAILRGDNEARESLFVAGVGVENMFLSYRIITY